MKSCTPSPVDVFPLYKKSAPVVITYDQPERNPRPKTRCATIDVFTLIRKKQKTVVVNNCPVSRFTWKPTVDVFPLIRGGC